MTRNNLSGPDRAALTNSIARSIAGGLYLLAVENNNGTVPPDERRAIVEALYHAWTEPVA